MLDKVYRTVISAMEARLAELDALPPVIGEARREGVMTMLETVDLTKRLDDEEYRKRLVTQVRLSQLGFRVQAGASGHHRLRRLGRGGKGGAIRRLTERLTRADVARHQRAAG